MKRFQAVAFIVSILLFEQGTGFPTKNYCPPMQPDQPNTGAPGQQPVQEGELVCGKWNFYGAVIGESTALSLEECEKLCTGECDVFSFASSVDELNCYQLSSKSTDSSFFRMFVDEKLCSRTYRGVEGKPQEGGCPQTDKPVLILGEFQTQASSVKECNDICAKIPECTHAIFRKDTDIPEGLCLPTKEDAELGFQATFRPSDSFCYVKQATERPVNPPGELKCGQWEFYGTELGNTTATSKEDCHAKCTGECDVSNFSPTINNGTCHLFNSRKRGSSVVVYLTGEVLCSNTYVGVEPKFPEGGCLQTPVTGIELNPGALVRSVRTNDQCKVLCQSNSECTHYRVYWNVGSPYGYCDLVKEDAEEGEELYYFANQSICPRS